MARARQKTHNRTNIVDRTSSMTVHQLKYLLPHLKFEDETETDKQLNEMIKLAPGCFTQNINTRDTTAQFLGCLEEKLNKIDEQIKQQRKSYLMKNKDLSLLQHKKIETKNFESKLTNFRNKLDLLTLGYGELFLKINAKNREYGTQLKLLFQHLIDMVHKSENESNFMDQSNLSQLKLRVKHQFHELKKRKEDQTKEINSLEEEMNRLINENYEFKEEINQWRTKTEGMENQIKKFRFTSKFYKKKYDLMKEHYQKVVQARLTEKFKIENIQEKERQNRLRKGPGNSMEHRKGAQKQAYSSLRQRRNTSLLQFSEGQNKILETIALEEADRERKKKGKKGKLRKIIEGQKNKDGVQAENVDYESESSSMNTSLASDSRNGGNLGELRMLNDNLNHMEQVNLGIMIPTGEKLIDFKSIQVGSTMNTQEMQTDISLVSPIYNNVLSNQDKIEKLVQEDLVKRKIEAKVTSVRENAKFKLKKATTKIKSMQMMNKLVISKNLKKTKQKIMSKILKETVRKLQGPTSVENLSQKSFDPDEIRPTQSLLEIKKPAMQKKQRSFMLKNEIKLNQEKEKTFQKIQRKHDEIRNVKELIISRHQMFMNSKEQERRLNNEKQAKIDLVKTYQTMLKIEDLADGTDKEMIVAQLAQMYENEKREKMRMNKKFEDETRNCSQLEQEKYSLKLTIAKLQRQIDELNSKMQKMTFTDSPLQFRRMGTHQFENLDNDLVTKDSQMESTLKGNPPTKTRVRKYKRYNKKKTQNVKKISKAKKQAHNILQEIQSTPTKKLRNFLPLKQVLKLISQLYSEKIKEIGSNDTISNTPVIEFVYEYYLHSFGFTSIAEPKYRAFLSSLKRYSKIFRINVFSKFICMTKADFFTLDEFNTYVVGLKFLVNSSIGQNVPFRDTDTRMMTPFIRCADYLKKFCENLDLKLTEINDLKKFLDKLRENDKSNKNKHGVVDQDKFLEYLVRKYRIFINRTKQFVKNAFKAADLDGNGFCSLEEFLTLWKYINYDSFEEERAMAVFQEEADEEDDGELAMSFNKFAMVSSKNRLFSEAKQFEFIGVKNTEDLERKYKSLKTVWTDKRIKLVGLFDSMKRTSSLDPEEIEGWVGIIDQIDKEIKSGRYENSPVLLISMKMLELEVATLVQIEGGNDMNLLKKHSLFRIPTMSKISEEDFYERKSRYKQSWSKIDHKDSEKDSSVHLKKSMTKMNSITMFKSKNNPEFSRMGTFGGTNSKSHLNHNSKTLGVMSSGTTKRPRIAQRMRGNSTDNMGIPKENEISVSNMVDMVVLE